MAHHEDDDFKPQVREGRHSHRIGNDDPHDLEESVNLAHLKDEMRRRFDESPTASIHHYASELMRLRLIVARQPVILAEKSANSRQVAGSHYGGGAIQHWDLAVMFKWNWAQYQITKYVMRYLKKNGLQDLEKAQHFLEKLIEEIKAGRMPEKEV